MTIEDHGPMTVNPAPDASAPSAPSPSFSLTVSYDAPRFIVNSDAPHYCEWHDHFVDYAAKLVGAEERIAELISLLRECAIALESSYDASTHPGESSHQALMAQLARNAISKDAAAVPDSVETPSQQD